MMRAVTEIIFLIVGIWTIVTGRLPHFVCGAQYRVEGFDAKGLGVIMMLPIPLVMVTGFILTLFFGGETALDFLVLTEIFTFAVMLISILIILRFVRKPIVSVDNTGKTVENLLSIEAIIAKKTQASIVLAAVGAFIPAAIITCPLAFIQADQALHLINEHQVGENYHSTAYLARVLAMLTLLLAIGAVFCKLPLVW